jgi:hypothetical protein
VSVDVEKELQKKNHQGSVDALNTSNLMPSDNGLGIPLIGREQKMPGVLMPYRTRLNEEVVLSREPYRTALHFFLDDYRFEGVWSRPREKLKYVSSVGFALSPDFSLYRDWPLTVQLWNVYRNRWCGAYWQSRGVRVIPTISWSTEESYTFCFLGVEQGSAVAISSVGVDLDNRHERSLFVSGCRAMVETIEPETIMLQAEVFPEELVEECGLSNVDLRRYPSHWQSIRQAEKEAHQRDFERFQESLDVG